MILRKIKFRCYDKMSKTWVYMHVLPGGVRFQCKSPEVRDNVQHWSHWQQLTPLKDRLNKEIWEGDIGEMAVTTEFGSQMVLFGVMKLNGNAQFAFDIGEQALELTSSSPPWVVGNILENPELVHKAPNPQP